MLPRNALHSLTERRHQRSTTRECSCADQSSHYNIGVDGVATFFARLHLHKLKLSPDKSRISATRVDFLGHVILADGVRPNDARVAALARMPMPTGIKQLRSLLGGLSYYRKFLPNMAYHIRPVTAPLEKSAAF